MIVAIAAPLSSNVTSHCWLGLFWAGRVTTFQSLLPSSQASRKRPLDFWRIV